MSDLAATAGGTLDSVTFEDAMRELEGIVARMDDGSLGLAESLGAYQRGMELVKHCQSALAAVREQVQVLEGATLKPWSGGGGEDDAA